MSRIVEHAGTTLLIRFPFDRRLVERVKSLPDRRWNPLDKVWTVPEGEVLAVVEALHAEGFAFDDEVKRRYESAGGPLALGGRVPAAPRGPTLFDAVADDPSPAPAASTDYTVARLNREVKAVLEATFPAPVWLVGEISGFNKSAHKKHVGFSLVELSPSGERLAEVGAILFQDARRAIEAKLAAAGDPFRLEDEIAGPGPGKQAFERFAARCGFTPQNPVSIELSRGFEAGDRGHGHGMAADIKAVGGQPVAYWAQEFAKAVAQAKFVDDESQRRSLMAQQTSSNLGYLLYRTLLEQGGWRIYNQVVQLFGPWTPRLCPWKRLHFEFPNEAQKRDQFEQERIYRAHRDHIHVAFG